MELFNSRAERHKANFHAHTTRSDGLLSPAEAEALYRSRGYDVLALTDHWRAGPTRSDGDFILLGGVEFATRNDSVDGMPECWHVVGLGVPE
ncbi:MAG: phosphotransferase, partial [Clostridia bacterium]|nr:phosphotransferase [Clostridia bacterium]